MCKYPDGILYRYNPDTSFWNQTSGIPGVRSISDEDIEDGLFELFDTFWSIGIRYGWIRKKKMTTKIERVSDITDKKPECVNYIIPPMPKKKKKLKPYCVNILTGEHKYVEVDDTGDYEYEWPDHTVKPQEDDEEESEDVSEWAHNIIK